MATMHPDQVDVGVDVVRALLRAQHPRWADLPIRPLAAGGTVNAVFRLGDALSVRLPLTASGVDALVREARWLPRIAPVVPLPTPTVVATGEAGPGYPFPWAVHRWIEGWPLVEGALGDGREIARDLASFVLALRGAELGDGPPAHRSSPLAQGDTQVRAALESLRDTDEGLDVDGLLAVWTRCGSAPAGPAPQCWIHSDLMPSNLLGADDHLNAVIDFGTVGLGDPAVDLIPAWNLLPAPARAEFRAGVRVDDDTWARGRGWALSMAAVQLPYYRTTNAVISNNARYVFDQVLRD